VLSALPPARRRLLLGIVAVLVAGVLAAVIVVVVNRPGSSNAAPPVAQDEPGPVLLVPGYGGSTSALDVLAARLRSAGRQATVVRLPADGTGDLRDQADALDRAARSAIAGGAPSVDVVGYSAGGVVARLWAEEDGGAAIARRIVTLGAPHHGTDLAALAGSLLPGQCPTACAQLAPNSDLLTRLNTRTMPTGPVWVSVWTEQDQIVTPPDSARLDGALNIPVQSVCAKEQLDHSNLPRDPVVQSLVLTALAPARPTQPTACPVRGSGSP
jgi:triacylglycerol esterase/lipase EstA (alpha/beta hydrolase family)